MPRLTRRHFVLSGMTALVSTRMRSARAQSRTPNRPLAIASANRVTLPDGTVYYNGIRATARAFELMRAGSDPLDAVIAGVTIVEDDPNDMSVGYGGLPNEEGEVELDASVMHGPTGRCGAVAALRYIKNPSRVARLVMEETDHILLVGEGALRFALSFGFQKQDLLTERARQVWLQWRRERSERDHWMQHQLPGALRSALQTLDGTHFTGTINCLAITEAGDLAGVTTTSGLAFKVPGRVGDSPIIGCGLYVDNDVGAAGSTGWGEDNIRVVGAHTVVENMRRGMSPLEACLDALRRIVKLYGGRPAHQVNFYALNKNGEYAGAAIFKGAQFAVTDARGSRVEDSDRQPHLFTDLPRDNRDN